MFEFVDWLKSSSMKQRILLSVLALLVVVTAACVSGFTIHQQKIMGTPAWQCQNASEAANPVQAENACPGTSSWQEDHPLGPADAIEGFTAPISVQSGQAIKLYVSTTAPTYTFEIYRLGWYNGLGGRLIYSSGHLTGIRQPAPLIDPTTRMVSCDNWRSPVDLAIPTTWVSGVYIVKLLAGKYMRYAYFVVRDDASHSAILMQTSVLTYEAYNMWGGYSLYRGPGAPGEGIETSTNRSYAVSFDRPFQQGDGLGDFPLLNEFNLLRWLERSGYDVSYTTDIDTDMRGSLLLQHQLFIDAGHDEYWSTAMRTNVTAARDAKVSLAFFGGNDLYWHVRLQSSIMGPDRVVICYKPGYYADEVVDPLAARDPSQDTVLWADPPLNQPQDSLLGEMYGGAIILNTSLVLAPGASSFFAQTSLRVGSAIADTIGGEYDRVEHNAQMPANLSILAVSPLRCIATSLCPANGIDRAESSVYTAASGAKVFDAGTFYWAWGLDGRSFAPQMRAPSQNQATPDFQQFTRNLLAYLLR